MTRVSGSNPSGDRDPSSHTLPSPRMCPERKEAESFKDFGNKFVRLHTNLAPDLREYIPTNKKIHWKIGQDPTTFLNRADFDGDFPSIQADMAQLAREGVRHDIVSSSINSDTREIQIRLRVIAEGDPDHFDRILRYHFSDEERPMINKYEEFI